MTNPYSAPETTNEPHYDPEVQFEVRSLKLITIGLAIGPMVFLGIALVLSQGAIDGKPDIVAWLALGFAGLQFLMHILVPPLVAHAAIRRIDSRRFGDSDVAAKAGLLLPIFRQRHIIAMAMLEAAAFFNLVAYIISRFGGNLAVAAVLILLIAVRLPSAANVHSWIHERLQEIEMS
ncbi:MAG: hypothetical protein R3C19_18235 [Planctomycetaceae bacterium]